MRRHFHLRRVRTVAGRAVNGAALDAHLRPAGDAVLAGAATVIVMHHDAVAGARHVLRHALAHRGDEAARLVPGNDRAAHVAEAERGGAARRAVEFEIAAAHARRLDIEHDLAEPGRRIRELHQLELAVSLKGYCAHRILVRYFARGASPNVRSNRLAYNGHTSGLTTRDTGLPSSASMSCSAAMRP